MPSGFYAVRNYIQRSMQVTFPTNKKGSCAHCNGKIRYANHVNCSCGICTYCSLRCAENDEDRHSSRCRKIVQLSADIETKTTALQRYYPDDEIALFDYSSLWVDDEELRPIIARRFQSERTELLNKRNTMIKELMDEGSKSSRCAGEYTNQNVYAYQVAAKQSLDLLLLRKGSDDAESVLTIHLLTGNFEKLYDLCCHYMLRGIYVHSTRGKGLDMLGQRQIKHRNVTNPYAPQVYEDYKLFGEIQFVALIHIFLVKYILHMSMEGLHQINTNFLNNKDCMILIGEYVGMKKEWIIAGDNNTYKDQAYEIARMIHCSNLYGYNGYESKVNEFFDKVKGGAQEYSIGRTSVIDAAITTGKRMVSSFRIQQKIYKTIRYNWPQTVVYKPTTSWPDIINSFEADLAVVYNFEVRSLLMAAARRINILAGWDVFGSNSSHRCTTEFVTDALKTCPEYSFNAIFHNSDLSEIFYGTSRHDYEDLEELFDENEVGNLDESLLMCVSLEQKLAYCNFHMNKESDKVVSILAQLPGENPSKFDPLPDSGETSGLSSGSVFAVRELLDSSVDIDLITMANNKLVTALFKQGLATKENLDILFGRSGYASYQIWKLQKQKEERRQPSIWSFITNSRLWKEGCVDKDRRSGLKIRYLNRQDRSQRFVKLMQELTKLVPIGSVLQSVVPSVEQFVSKFGWKCLGDAATKQLLMEWISSSEEGDKVLNMEDNSNPKRRRCDLDSFLTVEDACRHYFDTRSLEEGVWDAAGVPRNIVLNGNRERMQKTGWKIYSGGIRGDLAVKLGTRIAHVYSPSTSCFTRRKDLLAVYEEQVKPVYKERPEMFSGFDKFKYRRDFTC